MIDSAPQVNVYNNLGQECVGAGCSVDLFVFNNSYIDLATIGQVSRLSGGEIYKYTYFQVYEQLLKNLSVDFQITRMKAVKLNFCSLMDIFSNTRINKLI
jgi:hypothetical protein